MWFYIFNGLGDLESKTKQNPLSSGSFEADTEMDIFVLMSY